MSDLLLRSVCEADAACIARIYNHYVTNTWVTFETEELSPSEMATRIAETAEEGLPWLVAESPGTISGFAYASRWKGRCAYRYSVESTIYLDPDQTGCGIGTQLYSALLDQIRDRKIRVVIGGISLPNEASTKLHERLGFRKVGHFEQVGYKFDQWIDVGYWQLTL